MVYQVNGSRAEWNPSAARLRALTEKTPDAVVTEFGNVNVKARLDSRSTRSTYLVEDSTKFLRVPAISPFFPRDMADMGNRLLELLDSHEVQAFELNTGLDDPWSNRWGYRGENRRGKGRRELHLLTGAFPALGTLAVTATVMRKAAAWELVTWSTGCTSAGSRPPCRPAPSRATSG